MSRTLHFSEMPCNRLDGSETTVSAPVLDEVDGERVLLVSDPVHQRDMQRRWIGWIEERFREGPSTGRGAE